MFTHMKWLIFIVRTINSLGFDPWRITILKGLLGGFLHNKGGKIDVNRKGSPEQGSINSHFAPCVRGLSSTQQ